MVIMLDTWGRIGGRPTMERPVALRGWRPASYRHWPFRCGNHSRKNSIYRAFRELGRAIRTTVLLRYLSEAGLRDQIAKATNKTEAFNGFSKWLAFGSNGLLTSRDPELQEKTIKFLNLVANSVVLSVAVDITEVLRQLAAEGWEIDPEDFAVLSPCRREVIRRFGDYVTEGLHVPPAPFDPRLDLVTMPPAA